MKNKNQILNIIKILFSAIIFCLASLVVRNGEIILWLIELLNIYFICKMLSEKCNKYISNILWAILWGIYIIQLVVLYFSGTFITATMVANLNFIEDLSGHFGIYICALIPFILCIFIPIDKYKIYEKLKKGLLLTGIIFELVILMLFSDFSTPLFSTVNLISELIEISKTEKMLSIENDRYLYEFYKTECSDYISKPDDIKEYPNIVIIFTEGLSQSVIDDDRNLLSNIKNLENNSIVFDNYYNHTFATLKGLVGQLFSGYQFTNLDKNHLISLQSILEEKGYDTTFINTEPNNDDFKNYLENLGFKEVISDISLADDTTGYISDADAYEYLYKTITEKAEKDIPFCTAIYTYGTHQTLDSPDEIFGEGKNSMLNKFYNVDVQFGKFMKKFKDNELFDNTILIFTTDHATYRDAQYRDTFKEHDRLSNELDKIPFYIYYNGIESKHIDADGRNSLDFAPTVLDYLDISNYNYFLGDSLFGNSENYYDTIFYDGSDCISTNNQIVKKLDQDLFRDYKGKINKYFEIARNENTKSDTDDYITTELNYDNSILYIKLFTDNSYSNVWFPLWSVDNKQEDICWFVGAKNEEGIWECTAELANYSAEGDYIIHAYMGNEKPEKHVASTTVYFEQPTPETRIIKLSEDEIKIELLSSGNYDSVEFAVWESENPKNVKWLQGKLDKNNIWTYIISTSDYNVSDNNSLNIHTYVHEKDIIRCVDKKEFF